jgi:hypothetical protein
MSVQHSPFLKNSLILIASTTAFALCACHDDANRASSHSTPPASSAQATPSAATTPAATARTRNDQNHLAATYQDSKNDLELANAGAGGGHSGHHGKGKGGTSGDDGTGMGGRSSK